MFTQNSRPHRALIVVIGIVAALVLGAVAVAATPLVNSDKRINQVSDFGGDALYCMDASNNPTNDSSTFDHFRLLNENGVELWTLSRADVEHGLGSVRFGWKPVLLGTGKGTFGVINLYANAAQDGTPYFIFTGFDDHYKPNIITFYGCSTVGTAIDTSAATEEPA